MYLWADSYQSHWWLIYFPSQASKCNLEMNINLLKIEKIFERYDLKLSIVIGRWIRSKTWEKNWNKNHWVGRFFQISSEWLDLRSNNLILNDLGTSLVVKICLIFGADHPLKYGHVIAAHGYESGVIVEKCDIRDVARMSGEWFFLRLERHAWIF